jgi:hypothetical protein
MSATARQRVVKSPRGRDHVHVTYVDSDQDAHTTYEIMRRQRDGVLRCGCMAFVFNKETPKTCKHLLAFLGSVIKSNVPQSADLVKKSLPIPRELPSVTTRGETFTFRRGMTFGSIPTGGQT